MNETKVPGIWKWTVILLIACNIGLILTIWLKPHWGAGSDGGGDHRERPRNYVIEKLKFTDKQVKKYDELIKDHRSAMDRLREQSMDLRKLLFTNIKNEPGGLNTDSLAQLIANNQKEIETVTYKHFAQVRATICTEAQKPEFDNIIEEVIKKMNGGNRAGQPPHEHDGQHARDREGGQPQEGNDPPPQQQ